MSDQTLQTVLNAIDQLVILVLPIALSWAAAHWALRQRAETMLARQDLVGVLARTAVRGAEQALAGQAGEQKKQWALSWIEKEAANRGITVTPQMVETFSGALEAAVHDLGVTAAIVPAALAPLETKEATPAISSPVTPPLAGDPTARLAATPQGGATS